MGHCERTARAARLIACDDKTIGYHSSFWRLFWDLRVALRKTERATRYSFACPDGSALEFGLVTNLNAQRPTGLDPKLVDAESLGNDKQETFLCLNIHVNPAKREGFVLPTRVNCASNIGADMKVDLMTVYGTM